MTYLPLCDVTEIPRLLCDHCGRESSFTMTETERAYLAGHEVYAPATSAPPVVSRIEEYSGGSWSEPRDVKVVDSSTICRTPGCTRPSGDAFVCAPCADDLEMCLGDVPKLVEDLQVMEARQVRMNRNQPRRKRVENSKWDHLVADSEDATGIRKPGGRILAAAGYNRTPYNAQASDRLAYLTSTLVAAVRMLTAQRGLPVPSLDGPATISRWLLARVQAVVMDEAGGDIVADVKREHARAMHTIDCPPDLTYIGLCDECRAPMHADESKAEYRCRDCSAEYVVADRLEAQQAKVRGSLLSLREIAELSVSQLGRKITLKQLEGLVRRDRLKPAGHRPGNGRHEQIALYRAADVVAIMDRRAETPA